MQCQRCHFENMPGQQRCFKCGSILEGEITILDVHPPRMASWKRPWRKLARQFHSSRLPDNTSVPQGPSSDSDYNTAQIGKSLFFGIIPGLGHVVHGEGVRISPVVLAWIVDMGIAWWQIPSSWGWTALGVAAGIHAWLTLDAGLLRQLDHLTEKLITVSAGFLITVLIYISLALVLQPIHPHNGLHPSFGWAHTFFEKANQAIPAERIEVGDVLRLRPWDPNIPVARGTLIRHHALAIVRNQNNPFGFHETDNRAMGQIIGLPQEVVAMDANQFFINGTGLDPNRFPVPNWLLSRTLGPLQVDANQLFVATPYPRTRLVPSTVAQQACLVDTNDIDGRATMLWLPTSRRHRLVPDPNQDTWQP